VLAGQRHVHDLGKDEMHLVTKPATMSPLAVSTHYRWSFVADDPLKFRPRDNAPYQFVNKYTSGWIPAAAWDDVNLHALNGTHFHVNIDQRGFIQM
jgi:hypothetical protein